MAGKWWSWELSPSWQPQRLFSTRLLEVVPAHQDLDSISVDAAQNLSRTKYCVITWCGNGRYKRSKGAGDCRGQVTAGGRWRLSGQGPGAAGSWRQEEQWSCFCPSDFVHVFRMHWRHAPPLVQSTKFFCFPIWLKPMKSYLTWKRTPKGIIISVFSRWEKNDHPVLLINSKAVARVPVRPRLG